jgi:hypothetical protein
MAFKFGVSMNDGPVSGSGHGSSGGGGGDGPGTLYDECSLREIVYADANLLEAYLAEPLVNELYSDPRTLDAAECELLEVYLGSPLVQEQYTGAPLIFIH